MTGTGTPEIGEDTGAPGIGRRRPGAAHALFLLAAFSQVLFLIGVGHPATPYFDETHYVPAARALIGGADYVNIEHPLFAKTLIGLGILLFGDNALGWRFFGTLAGTATVAGIFLIAQALFRDVRISLAAGVLTVLNQLVFIHARIAMLDGFMAAFLVFALYFLVNSYSDRDPGRVRAGLIAAGLCFGLSLGSKWAAAPYIAATGLLLAALRLRAAGGRGIGAALLARDLAGWRGVSTAEALGWLWGVAGLAYLATFAPAFLVERNPLTLAELLPQQLAIYRAQTQPLAPHPYMSEWWQWPLIGRPIWYLYERVEGVLRGVLLVGNPAIMWGGLVAVGACLWGFVRARDPRLLLVAGAYLFSIGIWVVIPKKIGFYYYYHLPALFLSLALAAAFAHFCRSGRARAIPPAFLALALALFVYFHPIISAAPLPGDQAFLRWTWFESWR